METIICNLYYKIVPYFATASYLHELAQFFFHDSLKKLSPTHSVLLCRINHVELPIPLRTKKVLGVTNWSRASETSAVSREVPMTKELLMFLTETQGNCIM